jgi:hypothetical protein
MTILIYKVYDYVVDNALPFYSRLRYCCAMTNSEIIRDKTLGEMLQGITPEREDYCEWGIDIANDNLIRVDDFYSGMGLLPEHSNIAKIFEPKAPQKDGLMRKFAAYFRGKKIISPAEKFDWHNLSGSIPPTVKSFEMLLNYRVPASLVTTGRKKLMPLEDQLKRNHSELLSEGVPERKANEAYLEVRKQWKYLLTDTFVLTYFETVNDKINYTLKLRSHIDFAKMCKGGPMTREEIKSAMI